LYFHTSVITKINLIIVSIGPFGTLLYTLYYNALFTYYGPFTSLIGRVLVTLFSSKEEYNAE